MESKTCLVVSTMSSGKSTLINAILGEDILLSKNQACTAKSYYLKINRKMKNKLQIRGYRDELLVSANNVHIKDKEAIKKQMNKLNIDDTITKVEILANIEFLKWVSIIDTPGTNNSLDENHMKITIDTIKNSSYDRIIYLLNATQLSTNDDKALLQNVKRYMNIDNNKIVFVLNKVDEIDTEQDGSLESIHKNCKKYLESCGFENPKVFMTSAYLDKLIQKRKNKEILTRREKQKLDSLSYIMRDKKYNLDFINKNEYIQKNLPKLRNKTEINRTGVSELRNYLIMGEI